MGASVSATLDLPKDIERNGWKRTNRKSEFDRDQLHYSLVVVKLRQPVDGIPFGLVVAHQHKVFGRAGDANTLIERQQYFEKFAELKT